MKKWLIAVLCATLCIVLTVGTANWIVDPLLQYRVPPERLSYILAEYDYVNPGLAKHADYDALLVGTSLAENTDMDVYAAAFGCRMAKLIYPGGTTKNYCKILDVAYRTHSPKTVLWCVDEDSLFTNGSANLRHELPEYLYDEDRLNDIAYLLNLRIFYNFTCKSVMYSLRGRSNRPLLRGSVWGSDDEFGKEAVLSRHDPEAPQKPLLDETFYADNVNANLHDLILPLLREHRETEFLFFFPPKCITYWRNAQKNGVYDAKFYAMRLFVQTILREENARVFFFADRVEWTTDLSQYKDSIHFKPEINDQMGLDMAQGRGELTADTADAVLDRCAETWRDETEYFQALGIQ